MANQSFSHVHPFDSTFSFTNKMLNDEHNDSGLNNVNSDSQNLPKTQPHHLLFKDPINFYEYQPNLQSNDFTGFGTNNNNTDQYSSSNISLTSRSVPSSRRNSNEKDNTKDKNSSLEAIFDTKLQLGNDQNGLGKLSNRSSLTNTDIIPTTLNQSTSSLNEITNNNMTTQPSDTLVSSFAFDPNSNSTNHIFQQSPHLSQNNSVYQQPTSTFVTPNDYGEFFNGNLQKSSARHNKSLESLRSKSWTQYLDNPNAKGAFLQQRTVTEKPFEEHPPSTTSNRLNNSTATAFYNPTPLRRLSYGWQGSDSNRYPGFNTDLNGMKSRLTTSQSYSDLRASTGNMDPNQPFGNSSAASFGFYNGSSSDVSAFNNDMIIRNATTTKDQPTSLCQQYIQFGYCTLGDQCNFIHPILPSMNDTSSSSPRSQHSGITTNSHHSTTSMHPPMYSSYPINALFNSSATILNSTGINNPGTTTSTIFPVGASSSVYGRPNTLLPFHPSPTQQHQHLYKHQQDQLLLHHHQQQQQQQQIQQQQQQQQQIRRLSSDQDANRYVNANLDDFKGHLYELAKDQNGCRFLQRKIEDTSQNNTQAIQAIYDEIHNHFVELMTNSFGNYLCQKLLERCDNQQRDTIVEIVAPDIVNISLNMHGTRAVQKLIEFLSTPEQIQVITSALNPSVVPLIKDLNGNHVIQKCLHRLSAEHRQFIYDAVSDKCVEVATHKHGCCVLQRCIDYASDSQKAQLVEEITRHALPLVQDPYGNYVVQYVLELGDAAFSDGLIRRFIGHTCYLSAQKFSSNVIEKCIRVAEPGTRKLLIAEFIDQTAMEKLLRDSYANYVIQTSLDYTDPNQRTELVECIRPLLASIRSTPYGKRIHGKIYRDQHRSIAQPSQPEQQRSPQSNQGSITL